MIAQKIAMKELSETSLMALESAATLHALIDETFSAACNNYLSNLWSAARASLHTTGVLIDAHNNLLTEHPEIVGSRLGLYFCESVLWHSKGDWKL